MVCNKVIKIALICDQIDKDGKDVNYNDIYKLLCHPLVSPPQA